MGPLTFIIFMNNVVIITKDGEYCVIYADDSSFLVKLSGNRAADQEKMNDLMERVSAFMDSNNLAFNGSKTELVITSTKRTANIEIDRAGLYTVQ